MGASQAAALYGKEVIMEKAAQPLATEATHDGFSLRPKPDRRAHSRVQAADIARQAFPPLDTMAARIRAEYREMPGLRLTLPQAQRLCSVERALCKIVLDSLVDERFLCRKSDGQYARLTSAVIQQPQPAKADLRAAKGVQQAS